MSSIEEIKKIVEEVNAECSALGHRTVDRNGQQRMQYWLPDKIKQLLIAEFNRPESKKTHLALVKYFNPSGNQTWWFSEIDMRGDEYIADFYGIALIFEKEYGYTNLVELRNIRSQPFGLFIERDYHWSPIPLSEC